MWTRDMHKQKNQYLRLLYAVLVNFVCLFFFFGAWGFYCSLNGFYLDLFSCAKLALAGMFLKVFKWENQFALKTCQKYRDVIYGLFCSTFFGALSRRNRQYYHIRSGNAAPIAFMHMSTFGFYPSFPGVVLPLLIDNVWPNCYFCTLSRYVPYMVAYHKWKQVMWNISYTW